jgi:hypothetical protein
MKRWIPIIATVLVLLLVTAAADACPMCKDSVPTTDAEQAQAVPSGFNYSVYYMLLSVNGIRSTPARGIPNDKIRNSNQ